MRRLQLILCPLKSLHPDRVHVLHEAIGTQKKIAQETTALLSTRTMLVAVSLEACNLRNMCNNFGMAGRPKSKYNSEVATQLASVRSSYGLSEAALARRLGVHPATLCRARKRGEFSDDLAERIRGEAESAAADDNTSSMTYRDALLLLRKYEKMLPQIRVALDIVLDLKAKEG